MIFSGFVTMERKDLGGLFVWWGEGNAEWRIKGFRRLVFRGLRRRRMDLSGGGGGLDLSIVGKKLFSLEGDKGKETETWNRLGEIGK